MHYKRRDSKTWKGSGKVIGVDGQQILIKHGSSYVRCHLSHVTLKYTTDKGVHENWRSCSYLKEKTSNDFNKTYEDSSDSSDNNVSDNYDSDENDFPSEQVDNQNIEHQHDYTNGIQKLTILESRLKSAALNEDESHQLRVLAGQLNWLSYQTRPDFAFDAYQISVNMNKATIKEL